MTPRDLDATFGLIARLWPRAAWPLELQEETARRVAAIDITAACANKALIDLRMSMKFATIQPCEVLDALLRASRRELSNAGGRTLPELIRTGRWLDEHPAECERFGRAWLEQQGPRFAHWSPSNLTDPLDPYRDIWNRRFLRWVIDRTTPARPENDLHQSKSLVKMAG